MEDSLAHQRAGNLLHATQIVSKVQKRCIRTKIFHSQCNAISQISKKELFLCRDSPKNIVKQEKYATLYLISRQKRCFRHPKQNPPAKPPHLPSYSRDFISFWYPAYKHAGIWHACMPIPLRGYLACLHAATPARLSAGAAQEYQKDIKSPLETIPPFIVK